MQSGLLNPPGEPFRLSVPVLTVSGVILLLVSLQMLWDHSSTTGEFLGRYSVRYAVALLASLILLGVWTIALFRRQAVSRLIRGLPDRRYTGLVIISGLMVFGILVLPLEDRIQHFAALNWLAGLALTGLLRPDQPASRRWLWVGLPVVLGVWFIPAVISVLTRRAFSPDEAMWADYASSVFRASGMYARTWLQEPVAILPGLGWSVAGYGWLLEHVSFSLLTGRVWNFLGYVVAFVGIGLVTWRLYGLKPALINVAFAALSRAFVPVLDYRPDHQLPAAAMFITFAALQGRLSQRRGIWHFLCGLLATLALQIHAAGVVLAFGFSLFYLVESLPKLRRRQWQAFWPLLWFGIGALIGSLIYYLFNIQPVGGLEVFFNTLLEARLNTNRRILFLSWPSFFEWMLILSAFIYLIWRRSPADRLFLGILTCVLAGVVLLDYQGYRTHYNAFYIVPVGAMLVSAFNPVRAGVGRRAISISLGAILMLAGLSSSSFIAWPTVQQWMKTGKLPLFLYAELEPVLSPFIQKDDVVVSTHQLIWTFPDHPHLISAGAEVAAMRRWGLDDPAMVWQRVRPTIVVYVKNQMDLSPALLAYMEQRQFKVCLTRQVIEQEVTVYAENCGGVDGVHAVHARR
ncbi:MAG: hypothetical protein HXY41_00325 [Chloroflexi bacterium]|nr:hypothetical protein [Chloroflexota bacterium]